MHKKKMSFLFLYLESTQELKGESHARKISAAKKSVEGKLKVGNWNFSLSLLTMTIGSGAAERNEFLPLFDPAPSSLQFV